MSVCQWPVERRVEYSGCKHKLYEPCGKKSKQVYTIQGTQVPTCQNHEKSYKAKGEAFYTKQVQDWQKYEQRNGHFRQLALEEKLAREEPKPVNSWTPQPLPTPEPSPQAPPPSPQESSPETSAKENESERACSFTGPKGPSEGEYDLGLDAAQRHLLRAVDQTPPTADEPLKPPSGSKKPKKKPVARKRKPTTFGKKKQGDVSVEVPETDQEEEEEEYEEEDERLTRKRSMMKKGAELVLLFYEDLACRNGVDISGVKDQVWGMEDFHDGLESIMDDFRERFGDIDDPYWKCAICLGLGTYGQYRANLAKTPAVMGPPANGRSPFTDELAHPAALKEINPVPQGGQAIPTATPPVQAVDEPAFRSVGF